VAPRDPRLHQGDGIRLLEAMPRSGMDVPVSRRFIADVRERFKI
jgi:hypothetical protein